MKKKTEIDLPDSAFEPRNIKHRITIMLDLDLIEFAKEKAGGKGYQTLINETLRQAFFGEAVIDTLELKDLLKKMENRLVNVMTKKVKKKA